MTRDYLTDFQEVEQEILRLQSSPEVYLARRAKAVLQQRRALMYDLRELEKLGRIFENAGVTNEYLDTLTDGNDGAVDWEDCDG